MIQTSQKWKDYAQDGSIFHINAVVGNQTLTDADFMEGSLRFTDAVSGNSEITLGSVITNSFSATLNNTTGKFNNFNWNQELTLKFYPDYTPVEIIQRGIYRLEKPRTTGNTIQITGYDRMDLTNKYYIEVIGNPQTPITFPIKARALVEGLCAYCGVPFGSWNLANPDIEKFEYDESCTCRQVIAWTLQTLGGYARINNLGRMDCKPVAVIGWEVLENYEGGVFQTWNQPSSINGGTIQPWTAVASVDGGRIMVTEPLSVYKIKQTSVGMDDVVITGIRAYKYNTVDEFEFDTAGSDGYILGLSDNPLITNTEDVANRVWQSIRGFKMRPFSCTTFGDPSIEAGDAILVQDYLGNAYESVITNMEYSIGNQMLSCDCETQEANALETANPTTQIIKGATYAAYDYLLAKKITADVLNAGVLKSRESETNPNFYLDLTNGVLKMNATELSIVAKPIGEFVDDKVDDYDASLDQEAVFNKLTNNRQNQGIYIGQDGNLYINASMINTGLLTADRIGAGTISGAIIANNLTMNGGSVNITTASAYDQLINLNSQGGYQIYLTPNTLMFLSSQSNNNIELNLTNSGAYITVSDSHGQVNISGSGINYGGANMLDYVTSQGLDEDTGWEFRVWRSGKKECWKTVSVQNLAITNNWNNNGCNSNAMQTDNYPFTFASVPYVQVTAQIPGGYGWAMVGSVLPNTSRKTNIGYFYAVSLESITTSGTSYFHLYATS